MRRVEKKVKALSLLLAIAMLAGLLVFPVHAESGSPVYVSFEIGTLTNGALVPISGNLDQNTNFFVGVKIANNSLDPSKTVVGYDICVKYDNSVVGPPAAVLQAIGLTNPTSNPTFAENVVYAGWADANSIGITKQNSNYENEIQTSGYLFFIRFNTGENGLTQAQLNSFLATFKLSSEDITGTDPKTHSTVTQSTVFHGKNDAVISYLQTPALVVPGITSGIYDTFSASDVQNKISGAKFINAAGTETDVANSNLTITLPQDGLKAGDNDVTATYNGVSTTFKVTATEDTLSSIAVTTAPTKTTYVSGEKFDPAGMVVTGTYASGATKAVTDFTLSPRVNDDLRVANSSVSISYSGKSTSQAITVNPKSITPPTATGTYTYTGSEQTFTLGNNTDADYYTVTGDNMTNGNTKGTNAGNYTATVALNDKTETKWSDDNTTTNKTLTWIISPASCTYSVAETQDVKVGSGLSAITVAPVSATGLNGETVGGTVSWYSDSARQTRATDVDLSSKTVGQTATLYWKFTPTGPNYAAQTGSTTFTIVEGDPQTLTFTTPAPDSKTYGDAAFTNTVSVTSNSQSISDGGAVTYSSSNQKVATVNPSTGEVTIVGAGEATITANAAAVAGKYAAGSQSYTLNVAQKPVTITGLSAQGKTYDGNATATVTGTAAISGKLENDDVTVVAGSASFADKNAADGKTVTFSGYSLGGTDAANYNLTAQPASVTANISKKDVTITGLSVENKTYDGTPNATVKGTAVVDGIINDDTVTVTSGTASFADKNAANEKTVTFSGYSLGGTDAANYNLTAQPTSVTANITAKPITINGVTATNRNYNGTTTIALSNGELEGVATNDAVNFTLGDGSVESADASTASKRVTTNIQLTGADASNYTLTQPSLFVTISKADAPVLSAPTEAAPKALQTQKVIANKAFDLTSLISGVPEDAGSPVYTVTAKSENLTATISGTTLKIDVPNAQSKDTKAIVTVKVSSTNYQDASATINFVFKDKTPVEVTLSDQKVTYNGQAQNVMQGVYPGHAYNAENWTYTYKAADAATSTTEVPKDAGTYTVTAVYDDDILENEIEGHTGEATATLTVNPKFVQITGLTASSREYNGTTDAEVNATNVSFTGKIGDDALTLKADTGSASFSDKNVGNNKTVTFSGYQLDGAAAGNYTLAQGENPNAGQPASTTANITAKALTIDGVLATNRAYEKGNLEVELTGGTLHGVVGQETVGFDLGKGTIETADAGEGKTVTTNIQLNGADAGNYTLTQPTTVTVNITKLNRGLSAESSSLTLTPNAKTGSVTLSFDDVDNSAKVSCSLDNQAVKVSSNEKEYTFTAQSNGTATVTFTIPETKNYNAATAVTVEITSVTEAITDVTAGIKEPLAEGKDAVSAALSDDGKSIEVTGMKADNSEITVSATPAVQSWSAVQVGDKLIVKDAKGNEIATYNIVDKTEALPDNAANVNVSSQDANAAVKADENDLKAAVSAQINENLKDTPNASVNVDPGITTTTGETQPNEKKVTLAPTYTPAGATEPTPIKDFAGKVKMTMNLPNNFVPTSVTQDGKALDFTVNERTNPKTVIWYQDKPGEVTLTADDRNGSITYNKDDGSSVTLPYTAADLEKALETDSKENNTFNGWSFNGIAGTFKTLKDAVLSAMYAADNKTLIATPSFTPNSSGNNGGGGGAAPAAPVSVTNPDNGKVTLSPSSPKAGDTVTVTPTPDQGYKTDKVTVTDSKGNQVPVTKNEDGTYTFTVPKSNTPVKVNASFVKDDSGEKPDQNLKFVDVPKDAYYFDAVYWAVDQGITSGTSETTFSPDAPCTRAQAVTFLWRAAGEPTPASTENPFTDVKSDDYFYNAVLWAVEKGITKGTSATTFSPNDTVIRGQMVTFMYRAAGEPSVSQSNPFTDVAANAYYLNAVLWAVKENITSGTSATTFSPNADCLRSQIVTFLYRDAQ